ncbi:MAG: flagellar FlbD family protein [Mycobacteriales bacterium]|nr:flagellar FlbD family protein [Mycobacteriales bacterium]
MIRLTRLNGSEMYLNADLVATVESHHDTVVTLVDGKTYVVAERAEDVVNAVTTYRASVLAVAEQLVAEHHDPDHSPSATSDGVAQLLVLRPEGIDSVGGR